MGLLNPVLVASLSLMAVDGFAQGYAAPRKAKRSGDEVTALAAERPTHISMEKPLRVRLGILGGVAMQKTDFALGVGYDAAKLTERLRLVGDFTLAFRTTEVTFEPMGGVRLPFSLHVAPQLEPYVAGLIGANVTVLRGGLGVAIPVRIALGSHYEVAKGIGVGLELSMEVGPLVAPFADTYGAVHFSGMVAWGG